MIGITWSSPGTPYWSFGPTSEAAFGSVTSALCEGMLRTATLLKQHEAAFGSSTIRKVTAMARRHFGWRCGFVVALTCGWLAAHPPIVLAGEITPFSSDSAEADGLQSLVSPVDAVVAVLATPSLAVPVAPSVVSATACARCWPFRPTGRPWPCRLPWHRRRQRRQPPRPRRQPPQHRRNRPPRLRSRRSPKRPSP